jgi:hypothetical protein
VQKVDAIKFLTNQHRVFETLFRKYERSPQNGLELAGQIERALIPHAILEEMYVYPLIRERLPMGEVLAEHAIAEHSEVERTLKELGSLEPNSTGFDMAFRKVIESVREHIEEEEEEPGLLSRLRAAMDRKELEELGETLASRAGFVPTRAHPLAPDRPPANKVLGLPVAILDRARDVIDGRTDTDPAGRRRTVKRKAGERRGAARRSRSARSTAKTRSRAGTRAGTRTARGRSASAKRAATRRSKARTGRTATRRQTRTTRARRR